MKLTLKTLCSGILLAMLALPASATVFNFDVLYSGNNVASLAPGSDDPLTSDLQPGDSFTYSLTADAGEGWKVLIDTSIFPLFALSIQDGGSRSGDLTLDFLLAGVSQHSYSELGANNCCVHLGTNTVPLSAGLMFDKIVLDYSVLTSDTANTVPNSLLPWPGVGLESWSPNAIAYTDVGVVPEPPALPLVGLALVAAIGWARRRA